MVNKEARVTLWIFLMLSLVIIVLGIYFVLATITVAGGGTTFDSVNESTTALYNITVENTGTTASTNLTEVNVTIPNGFVFIVDSNDTSAGTHTFSNTSDVLTWSNDGLVMNLTNQSFWFNITSPSTPGNYNFTITTSNSTGVFETQNISITVNDTVSPSTIAFESPGLTSDGNLSQSSIPINISATDVGTIDSIVIRLYNSTQDQINLSTNSSTPASWFFNFTGLSDGTYYVNATVNDTFNKVNSTSTLTVVLDNINPSVSLSKSSSTTNSITVSYSCSDATSNVSSCSLSSSSGTVSGSTISGLSCENSYTITVTARDYAGNNVSSSSSYSTSSCGGGGITTTQPKKKVHSWTKITPGVVTIMKDFDKEYGIKQISIEVKNQAQNVKITITKYADKPAEVTKEKSGKVYKYLQIKAENLEDKLDKGIITIQVEKSWLEDNNLEKGNVALFKFVDGEWKELPITYKEEDSDNYYYDSEITSFSYFAIAEKTVIAPTCTPSWDCTDWSDCINETKTRTCTDSNNCGTDTGKPAESKTCGIAAIKEKGSIITIIVIIIVIAIVAYMLYKKKRYSKKGY